MTPSRLRIELDAMGVAGHVFYGDIEISDCVHAVTVKWEAGEVTTATLECYAFGGGTIHPLRASLEKGSE